MVMVVTVIAFGACSWIRAVSPLIPMALGGSASSDVLSQTRIKFSAKVEAYTIPFYLLVTMVTRGHLFQNYYSNKGSYHGTAT